MQFYEVKMYGIIGDENLEAVFHTYCETCEEDTEFVFKGWSFGMMAFKCEFDHFILINSIKRARPKGKSWRPTILSTKCGTGKEEKQG